MYISPISSNNQRTNFTSSYRVFFYTPNGERILSEQNMKKCLHYMEAHLNGSKRVKTPNQELISNMKYGQKVKDGQEKVFTGDIDYRNNPRIRSFFVKEKGENNGYVTILTGDDVEAVAENYGKNIGKAKKISKEYTGTVHSFETSYAVNQYKKNVPDYAEIRSVKKDDRRVAFGICFTPIYKRNGELKNFEYHHSGFFFEDKVKPNLN